MRPHLCVSIKVFVVFSLHSVNFRGMSWITNTTDDMVFNYKKKLPVLNKQMLEIRTNSARKLTLCDATFEEFRKLNFFPEFWHKTASTRGKKCDIKVFLCATWNLFITPLVRPLLQRTYLVYFFFARPNKVTAFDKCSCEYLMNENWILIDKFNRTHETRSMNNLQ